MESRDTHGLLVLILIGLIILLVIIGWDGGDKDQ